MTHVESGVADVSSEARELFAFIESNPDLEGVRSSIRQARDREEVLGAVTSAGQAYLKAYCSPGDTVASVFGGNDLEMAAMLAEAWRDEQPAAPARPRFGG